MTTSKPINVALVEDDPEDAFLLERALRKSGIDYQLTHLSRLSDALDYLENNLTDVVVLDLGLPDTEGLTSLERIQTSDPSVPIVILTGNDDQQNAKDAVEFGAQDYVSKNQLDGRGMARALTYAIHRKRAENRLRIGVSELKHVIETDELTGAINRRSLLRRLPDAWEFAERTGDPVSCVMADVDYFKLVNDTHGHRVGDEALTAVAHALLSIARPTDMVCRFGGEEFCVLLRGSDERDAITWAELARSKVGEIALSSRHGNVGLTISLGVATGPNQCGPTELIDRADQALLISKQRGRNRVTAFSKIDETPSLEPSLEAPQLDWQAPVRDFMTTPIECLNAGDSIATAVERLLAIGANSLPVVNDAGVLVGVVCEQELLNLAPVAGAWQSPIAGVMNGTVVSFQEDDSIEKLRRFFSRVAIRGVVITKANKPVGVLSRSNLLRAIHEAAVSASPIASAR